MNIFRKEVIIVVVVFSVGLIIVDRLKSPTERDQVIAAIEQIESAIEYEEALKPLQIPGRIKILEQAIVPGLEAKFIDGEKLRTYNNRDQIKPNVMPAAMYFSSIQVDRANTVVLVNNKKADVTFQAIVTGERAGQQEFRELANVELKFSKNEEGRDMWLLTAATIE